MKSRTAVSIVCGGVGVAKRQDPLKLRITEVSSTHQFINTPLQVC